MVPPTEALTLIERYGSFGLLCVLFFSGVSGASVFFWWFTRRAIPSVIEFCREVLAQHKAALEKKDADHREERKEEREAVLAALRGLGEKVDGHGERLDHIEERLDDGRQQKRNH